MNSSDLTLDDPIRDTSNRGVELLRRLLFVGGILCAVWLIAGTGKPLWRVKDVHFDQYQKSEAHRTTGNLKTLSRESGLSLDSSLNSAASQSPDAYIAAKTNGRLIHLEGSEWQSFFDDVAATLSGKSRLYLAGASVDTGSSYLYFPSDTQPLRQLASRVNKAHCFTFLDLQQDGQTRYLEVLCQPPMDARHYAPALLVYPGRAYAVWIFLAAVLSYALLPWPKYGERTLNYGRFRSVIIPDILGVTLTAAFFIVPVLVVGSNYNGPLTEGLFSVEKGWIWLTGTMWILAALSLGITCITLWYSVFWLTLFPQGLRYKTFFGIKTCAYSEIERVDIAYLVLPNWFKTVLVLAGFLNWRLMGALWLGAMQEAYGIQIRRKDGSTFKIWLDYLSGLNHVFRELRRANVPMSPELAKGIDEWLAECPENEPWPNASHHKSHMGAILVILAVAIPLGIHFWPVPPRKIIEESRHISAEEVTQRARLIKEMHQVRIELDAATKRYKEGPRDRRTQELEAMTNLMDRFNELSKQHDALSGGNP